MTEIEAAIAAERAAIVEGIKSYFAPVDDPLYEDVRILCDRITRGEYGARVQREAPPNTHRDERT
ncbi:hypothetical protein [Nonomuraea sp. NPDC002799]